MYVDEGPLAGEVRGPCEYILYIDLIDHWFRRQPKTLYIYI